MKNQKIIFVVVALVTVSVVYFFWRGIPKSEGYGGPVKRIKNIPKNDCYSLCDQYYNDCISPHFEGRYVDFSLCIRRKQACISNCNYTDFHRL